MYREPLAHPQVHFIRTHNDTCINMGHKNRNVSLDRQAWEQLNVTVLVARAASNEIGQCGH